MNQQGQIGIYFHWPFCLSKCPYCDFNVHVTDSIDHARWAGAYVKALERYAQKMPDRKVVSIFFGGGTPSIMAPETACAVVEKVRELWSCAADMEVTLEANPTSVEMDRFRDFRAAGVNRLSLGVQSLKDDVLNFLGRKHSADEARRAIQIAGEVFDRFSFDLIYARPEQDLDDWREELTHALSLADGHLSLYQLTIERNTPFYFDRERRKFSELNDDLAADFYDLTQDILTGGGLPAYEVSNHARIGNESVHNMIYWQGGDYIGIGPGAHGRLTLEGQRCAVRDHHAPDIWLERVDETGGGAHPMELLDEREQVVEALMTGLRLADGLLLERLESIAPDGRWRAVLDEERLSHVMDEGWLVLDQARMRLNREGRLKMNSLIPYILKS